MKSVSRSNALILLVTLGLTCLVWALAQALALQLMKAEKTWDHPAFFDYVDRWMYEDETGPLKTIKADTGHDHSGGWTRDGQGWERFVSELWAKYRAAPDMPPTDGWKRQHDDSYYKHAIENTQK